MVEGKYAAYGKYSVTCGKCFSATAWEDTEEAAEMRWNSRVDVEGPTYCNDGKWGQMDGIGVMHCHKYHIHKAEHG